MSTLPNNDPRLRTSHRPRFSLRTLLWSITLVSVIAALAGGLIRSQKADGFATSQTTFVLLSVLAPLAVVILLGTISSIREALRRWHQRNRR